MGQAIKGGRPIPRHRARRHRARAFLGRAGHVRWSPV